MPRLKQYNEAEVLQKAMFTFWEHGYEKTSVRTLEKSMGINQFSIYSTFKSKEELYKRVLAAYRQKLDLEFLSELKKANSSVTDVERFLKKFSAQITGRKVPNSCLMVNSTAYFDQYDEQLRNIIIEFFESMKSLFRKAIQNDVSSGKIPADTPINESAEYLVGIAQSISVYGKIKSSEEVSRYIEFAVSKL